MLSPDHQLPLTLSTPAVLSSSFSSSSSSSFTSTASSSSTPSSSPPTGKTVKHERKITLLSFSLSRLKTVFFIAMCVVLVSSATAVSTKPSSTSPSTMTDSPRNGSLLEGNDTSSHPSDLPQRDEPPRNIPASKQLPTAWGKQSQGRLTYLRANNDQYLQLHGNQITGTLQSRPKYGILNFFSHNLYVVIRSYHTGQYLCMNSSGVLYLKDQADEVDPECFIKEESLYRNGSLNNVYIFVQYSNTTSKRYLAINCDPIIATNTRHDHKAMRFVNDKVSEEEAKDIKREIEEGKENKPAEKCEKRNPELRLKQRRQRLRERWCWNLNRLTKKRQSYMTKCRKRNQRSCTNKNETCVCDILLKMMLKPKRAMRKCLKQRLSKWVRRKPNRVPNDKAITEAAKLLLPSYTQIARRIQNIRKKGRKSKHPSRPKQTQENAHRPGDTQSQSRRRHRTKGRRRLQIIKLNPILKQFGYELFQSSVVPDAEQPGETLSRTSSNQGSKTSVATQENPLSTTFVDALKNLSQHKIRHRNKHRNRRKGKNRRGRRGKKDSGKVGTDSSSSNSRKHPSSSPS